MRGEDVSCVFLAWVRVMQKNVEASLSADDIVIGQSDYLRVATLLISPGSAMPPEVRSSFLDALEDAVIVDDEYLPDHVVRIGSSLILRDCATGEERRCILSWPGHGGAIDCISVLTRLGSVLIGAAENTFVSIKDSDGRTKQFLVKDVRSSELLQCRQDQSLR